MKTTYIDMITPKHCPYTWQGENIANLRRVKLFRLAQAMNAGTPQHSKNDLLKEMITRLNAMGAEYEISDMIDG